MMELKTFTHTEEEGTEWEAVSTIAVIYIPPEDYFSENYIVNVQEPGHSFAIYPAEIPYYIEVLKWMRDHQASLPKKGDEDTSEDELPHDDSPGAREEEG